MRYPRRVVVTMALSVVTMALLLSCETGNGPTGPGSTTVRSCADVSWEQKGAVNFEVLSPDGGEVYHVGDTVRMAFCVNPESGMDPDDAPKLVSFDGGQSFHAIEHEFRGDTVNWIIPDSMSYVDFATFTAVSFSTISESCLFKVTSYDKTDPSVDFDVSDAVFAIKPRQ